MKKLLALTLLLTSTGCSTLTMAIPPTNNEFARGKYNPNCTTSVVAPIFDTLFFIGGIGGVAAAAASAATNNVPSTGNANQDALNVARADEINIGIGIAAGALTIVELAETVHGFRSAARCEEQKEQMAQREEQRQAEQAVAQQQFAQAQTEQFAAQVTADELRDEAEVLRQKQEKHDHEAYCASTAGLRAIHIASLATYKDMMDKYDQTYSDNKVWVSKSCKEETRTEQKCTASYLSPDGTVHPSVCNSYAVGHAYACKGKDRPRKVDGSLLSDKDAENGDYAGTASKDAYNSLLIVVSKEESDCGQ